MQAMFTRRLGHLHPPCFGKGWGGEKLTLFSRSGVMHRFPFLKVMSHMKEVGASLPARALHELWAGSTWPQPP